MKKCFLLFLEKQGQQIQFIKAYTEKDHQKAKDDLELLRNLENDQATVVLKEIAVYSKQTVRNSTKSNAPKEKTVGKPTNARKPATVPDVNFD